MTEYSPRSYLRDANGPRVVNDDRERTRASRYGDEMSHTKSRRSSEKKSRTKHESSSWQKSKAPLSSLAVERPTFRLDIINQPPKAVILGIEVATSVLASLTFSSKEAAATTRLGRDTSRLIGVASLVAETSAGDRVPMESDTMVAQQLVDTLRPVPEEFAQRIIQAQPCRVPLGYLSFSNLVIRQSGHYRIRLSLIQVPGAGRSPTTVTVLDSELIRVERRLIAPQQRRHQR